MQNSGQYGVSDAPQYVVGRQAAPSHIFSISHDNMSIAPPAAHTHAHALQHHLPHHLQAAQHHHYGPHPGHQPHPSLQQIHQTQQQQHSQHPQFPLPPHPSQQALPPQQQQQSPAPHQDVQQQHQHQHQHQHQQQQQAQQQARERAEQQQARERAEQQQREQEHQLAQQQAAAQQAMVQQLGLGGPDSPEVPSPGVSRPSPTKYISQQQQLVVSTAAAQEDDGLEEEGRSAGGNRWPRQETLALIKVRSEMDANFRDSGLKGPLWEEVSRKLAEQGYSRTAKKCKEKFENVHKYYKKTKDGKAGRQDGKSYRFFNQLEALYSGQEAAMQLGSRLAASAAASLLTDSAAAASLLTGSAAPGGKVADDYNELQQAAAAAQQRQSEVSTGITLSESMSEDDYDEPESGTGGENQEKSSKKRKRTEGSGKVGASKADFFSTLMKNLVEKQEGMQHKFLEFIERREQERQAREEQWRRQEMARVAREHEFRVQEQALSATRDAALVAFLQKVTGQTLMLPQILSPRAMVVPPAADSVVTPAPQKPHSLSPLTTPTPAATSLQLVTVASADIDQDRDSPVDPNSKRWPKPEVLTLIKLRSDMEPRFQEPGPKAPLWEEISQAMACLGYNRNQKRCKEKWENINKYFRKTKESNKKRPENAKTCPYFHQLELLYLKGVLGTPHNKHLAKVAASSEEKPDHSAVPLALRIEAAASPSEATLKMLPAAAEAVQNATAQNTATNSGNGSGHLFSSPENGSSADRVAPKAHVSEASV